MNDLYLKMVELFSHVDSMPKNIYLMTKDNKDCLNNYYDPDNEEHFIHTKEELKYLAEH